jgi:hypothetical protein
MTLTALPRIRRNTNAETAEQLTRDASTFLEAAHIVRSRSWISRVVRAFATSPIGGLPFAEYMLTRIDLSREQRHLIAENADLRNRLSYVDPTGETAARNVDKERGW